MSETNLKELYYETRNALREHGIHNADIEAREFIKYVIDIADIDIIIRSDQPVYSEKVKQLREGLQRRLQGEPVSRIFGEREFWSLPFKVTPDVLDPRPDTETIVDAAIRHFIGNPPEQVLDLGTGSGCLIVSLMTEWPLSHGHAVDISGKALLVASENARTHGVDDRITFVTSDWGESVNGYFDLIVSNPPYISNREIANLPPEVKNYDPILALEGGEDGLDCYRKIILAVKKLLKLNGICLLEVGYDQAEKVSRLVEDSGLFVRGVHPDMAGIPRVVEISFGEK